MIEEIKVRVGDTIHTYPADIAGFGQHLATGARVLPLYEAVRNAQRWFDAHRHLESVAGPIKALVYWVTLDESGLAYRVDIDRQGRHQVRAASPLPRPGNVRDVYTA